MAKAHIDVCAGQLQSTCYYFQVRFEHVAGEEELHEQHQLLLLVLRALGDLLPSPELPTQGISAAPCCLRKRLSREKAD